MRRLILTIMMAARRKCVYLSLQQSGVFLPQSVSNKGYTHVLYTRDKLRHLLLFCCNSPNFRYGWLIMTAVIIWYSRRTLTLKLPDTFGHKMLTSRSDWNFCFYFASLRVDRDVQIIAIHPAIWNGLKGAALFKKDQRVCKLVQVYIVLMGIWLDIMEADEQSADWRNFVATLLLLYCTGHIWFCVSICLLSYWIPQVHSKPTRSGPLMPILDSSISRQGKILSSVYCHIVKITWAPRE